MTYAGDPALLIGAGQAQDALGAEYVGAALAHEVLEPRVQAVRVQLARLLDADRRHRAVVLVILAICLYGTDFREESR